ncbi:hypothetical protein KQI88_15090 [Alkaliphilus sp. MSJ-5]|uniref:Transcriptional regulator n=1 Tax=Alkaliphilus flagellatus TaxID=2841507 RepID=A0ABS6G5U7_9FIRM|nr:hypothetical protein [Alkaliphilus flagellatus]MBU5677744.1 hypothetical protein [Alkaliphilus flagellatus]
MERVGQENQSDLREKFNDVINKMHVIHISHELGLSKRQAYLLKKGQGAKVDINKLLDFFNNIQLWHQNNL